MHPHLLAAVESCAGAVDRRALARAAEALSDAYRGAPAHPHVARADQATRVAYLVTRFPATLAALQHVAAETARRLDLGEVKSLLELGAGPGPARWAFADVLPALASLRSVDADADMLTLAQRLLREASPGSTLDHEHVVKDLTAVESLPGADLVVISYCLGELQPRHRERVVGLAWEAARLALVVVEPGTVAGFERVLAARDWLAAEGGGRILAPCPQAGPCPMRAPDWCHHAVRLERSRLHRRLKGGTLGYEDEKFSYVVASRQTGTPAAARIIARPAVHPGHVVLRLCEPAGLCSRTVARREGPRYRAARHLRWGDAVDA